MVLGKFVHQDVANGMWVIWIHGLGPGIVREGGTAHGSAGLIGVQMYFAPANLVLVLLVTEATAIRSTKIDVQAYLKLSILKDWSAVDKNEVVMIRLLCTWQYDQIA